MLIGIHNRARSSAINYYYDGPASPIPDANMSWSEIQKAMESDQREQQRHQYTDFGSSWRGIVQKAARTLIGMPKEFWQTNEKTVFQKAKLFFETGADKEYTPFAMIKKQERKMPVVFEAPPKKPRFLEDEKVIPKQKPRTTLPRGYVAIPPPMKPTTNYHAPIEFNFDKHSDYRLPVTNTKHDLKVKELEHKIDRSQRTMASQKLHPVILAHNNKIGHYKVGPARTPSHLFGGNL